MSEKNHIDELFKNGLDQKGIPYEESSWSAMESMLNDKASSSGVSFWHWTAASISAIILAVCLLLPFFTVHNTDQTELSEASQQLESEVNGSTTESNQELQHSSENSASNIQHSTSPEASRADLIRQSFADQFRHLLSGTPMQNARSNRSAAQQKLQDDLSMYDQILDSLAKSKHEKVVVANPSAQANVEMLAQIEGDDNSSKDLENKTFYKELPQISNSFSKSVTSRSNGFHHPADAINVSIAPYFEFGQYEKMVSSNIQTFKAEQESVLDRKSLGFDVRFEKRGFSIITGAGYSMYNEQTNYKDQLVSYTYDTSLVLVKRDYVTKPDGSKVALIQQKVDSTASVRDTVTCPDCAVRFNYITIPLAVRYDLKTGNFSHFVRAGFEFSFLSSAEGRYSVSPSISQTENNQMNLGRLDVGGPNNSFVQANFQIGTQYFIKPKWALAASMSYGQSLNSQMSGYSQKLKNYGLRFGFEWKLN